MARAISANRKLDGATRYVAWVAVLVIGVMLLSSVPAATSSRAPRSTPAPIGVPGAPASNVVTARAPASSRPASMSPSWSFLTPNESAYPYNRSAVAMAYDPQLNGTLLFGGYNVTVAADGDTWLFTNGSWVDLTPRLAVSPAARWYDSLVWDPVDHYLVLFGGGDTSRDYNDTWAFHSGAWTLE